MTVLKNEDKSKNEMLAKENRLFKNIPQDTLAESQATMRSILLAGADIDDNSFKNHP